jgi:hypothetical protein
MRSGGLLPAGEGRLPGVRTGALRPHVLLLLAALPLAGGAQVTATADYLARMDLDGDGRVSLAEYQAWMSYAFDGMDRNGDGVLSPDEQPGGRAPALTREHHLQRLAGRFAKQDANSDGFLDARELAAPPR